MMKIKVGDNVKFLNDVGGGKVTKIIDRDTALVLNDTGFEIPVLIEELMPEITENNYQSDTEPKMSEKTVNIFEEEPIYTDSPDVNLYLAYVPKNQKRIGDSDCDVYLINDSNYFVFYNYAYKEGGKYKSITGKLEPNVKEKISLFELNSLQDNINVVVQLIFFDKEEYALREPVSTHIKIKSIKFFKLNSFKENDFFDEFAIISPVIEENAMQNAVQILKKEDINTVLKQKENIGSKRPRISQKKEEKYLKEVDLHIHELIDDETGLSDRDKLQHQLDVFHREMKTAIADNFKRIVFIHGVGSGSLKLKIRSELQGKYKKYQFQDASFKEYGYGATMVLIRK